MNETDTLRQKLKTALRLDRAVRFVWEAGPGWTLLSLALVVLQGILPLAVLFVMKMIVDAVSIAIGSPETVGAFRSVTFWIGAAMAVALLNALFQSGSDFVQEAQSLKVTDHVNGILHAKSVAIDLGYYENPEYYDTLHRAQQEGHHRPTQIVNDLMQLGQSAISLSAVVGLLFHFHWSIAAVLFAAALPGIIVRLRYSEKMYRWQRAHTRADRLSRYFSWMLTGETHAKEVRLFGLGDVFIGRFDRLRNQLRRDQLNIKRKRSVADFIAQAVAIAAVFACFGFIAFRTVQGAITLGDMVMYFGAFQRGLGYLQNLLGNLAALYDDNLFISHFYAFLDLQPLVKEPSRPRPVPNPMRQGIFFDNVSFQYPSGHRRVLKGISMRIAPNETVALVGENGSGKTTLVKLICRLYDPTAGTITLDGIDLRLFATTDLRRELSVIFQDFTRYPMTAKENVWFGDIHSPPDTERIAAAARKAAADAMIRRWPQGYETVLGKWFEEGEELSTGQWQKMALARAFLRDAQLVVLDEPTSSLDVQTEHEVFHRFRKLREGKAAILISHRFSTVRMADRIFVLEEGSILESGSHEELLRYGGKYADLFAKQSKHYQ